MKGVFGRIGMVGAILVVSALIYGVIAGGVIIHRLESHEVSSSAQQQGNNGDDQGDKGDSHGQGQSKHGAPKHAKYSPEPDDEQDK